MSARLMQGIEQFRADLLKDLGSKIALREKQSGIFLFELLYHYLSLAEEVEEAVKYARRIHRMVTRKVHFTLESLLKKYWQGLWGKKKHERLG